jgi:hypothetical protein
MLRVQAVVRWLFRAAGPVFRTRSTHGPVALIGQPGAQLELGAGDGVPGHDALQLSVLSCSKRHGLDVIGRHGAGIHVRPRRTRP